MWQRLQTLYLAIATGLVAALYFSVKAFTLGPEGVHSMEIEFLDDFPYVVLLIVTTILQLIALFTFNQRVFQMRTASLSAIILIAFQGWLAFDYFTAAEGVIFRIPAVFPLVAAILDFIAVRYIIRDQLLVESTTHLRSRKKNHKI